MKVPKSELYNFLRDYPENEVGGSIVYGNLVNVVIGDKYSVYFDLETHPITFHTHPPDSKILYSFYSTPDIRIDLEIATKYPFQNRIFYLVVEHGIYSLQFTKDIINLVQTSFDYLEMVLFYFEIYVYPLMNPYVELTNSGLSQFVNLDKKCLGDTFNSNMEKMLRLNNVTGRDVVEFLIQSENKSAWYVGALERSGEKMLKCPKIFIIDFEKF